MLYSTLALKFVDMPVCVLPGPNEKVDALEWRYLTIQSSYICVQEMHQVTNIMKMKINI